MTHEVLCPFAKAIWGRCCQCEQAQLVDQRTRHVRCNASQSLLENCNELDGMFKDMAYNLKDEDIGETLTYSQLMKVRCGGFRGMQRLLGSDSESISDLVSEMLTEYNRVTNFPFDQMIDDMNQFQLRKRASRRQK
jgi:hypothetical protein